MNDKMSKAQLAMLKVQLRALELGCVVAMPTTEGTRYDCVIDDHGALLRAQVKYAGVHCKNSTGAVQLQR